MSKQLLGFLGGVAATVVGVSACLGTVICALVLLASQGYSVVREDPGSSAPMIAPSPIPTDAPAAPTSTPTPPIPSANPTTFAPTPQPPTPTLTPTGTLMPTLIPTGITRPPPPPPTTTPSRIEARVTSIVDGDSIEVEIGGQIYGLRYIGIDCPEPGQPGWYDAGEANRQLVEGQIVWLEKDESEADQHGRLLRYVYLGDVLINAELVRLGYASAKSYPPDVQHDNLFAELQQEASEAGRGLWAAPVPTSPAGSAWNCIGNVYNCGDFSSCAEVMDYWNTCPGDPSRLDGDDDGRPCESLCE